MLEKEGRESQLSYNRLTIGPIMETYIQTYRMFWLSLQILIEENRRTKINERTRKSKFDKAIKTDAKWSFLQAAVVQKVDSWINHYIQWITQLVFVILIQRIAIYPVDRAIQLLNSLYLNKFRD